MNQQGAFLEALRRKAYNFNPISLIWIKKNYSFWYGLHEVIDNPSLIHFLSKGVYIIRNEYLPGVSYIGQGYIIDRLREHSIKYYGINNSVTWAYVSNTNFLEGIEAYLIRQLNPRDNKVRPMIPSIPVNLP